MKTFELTMMVTVVCIIIAIFRVLYEIIAKKNIPKLIRIIHLGLYIVILILIVLTPYVFGYEQENQGEYMLMIFFAVFLSFIICVIISLKTSEYIEWKKRYQIICKYKKITAKEIAKTYSIEYLTEIADNLNYIGNIGEMYYKIQKDKYIEFLPINNILDNQHIIWEQKNSLSNADEKVISNINCFYEIQNIDEVLKDMIEMYTDSIEKDIFLSSYNFLLKFNEDVTKDYKGTAKLVITDSTLLNSKVELDEKLQYRKDCVSYFLNCFLGYNFGNIIRENEELNKMVKKLYTMATEKELIQKPKQRQSSCFVNANVQKYWYN